MYFCRRLLRHGIHSPLLSSCRPRHISHSLALPASNRPAGAVLRKLDYDISRRYKPREEHDTIWSDYIAMRQSAGGISLLWAPHIHNIISRTRAPNIATSLTNFKLIISDILQTEFINARKGALIKLLFDCPLIAYLDPEEAVELVHAFVRHGGHWKMLSVDTFDRVMIRVLRLDSGGTPDGALLDIVEPQLRSRLRPFSALSAASPAPSLVARHAILLIRDLFICGHDSRAVELFGVLLEHGLTETPPRITETQDVQLIVLLTLAKSCMDWHWREVSLSLVEHILSIRDSLPPKAFAVASDVIMEMLHLCMSNPTFVELERLVAIVRASHPTQPLPDIVIRHIYLAAHQSLHPFIAAQLFKFINRSNVVQVHRYPPPPVEVCRWLLDYFQQSAAASHWVRMLITGVADNETPLPVDDRAKVVRHAAKSGFGLLAKYLWERYTTGRDGVHVAGNPASTLAILKLFARMQNVNTSRAADDVNGTSEDDPSLFQQRADEDNEFLERVLDAFVLAHSPLDQASHHVLTTTARAYFIVGRTEDAFNIYPILAKRKMTPDVYDIGVILKSLAERSPRTAARIIDQMVDKGYLPSGPLFGTVMHYAFEQNDTVVFYDLLRKASNLGVDLTVQTFVSLIRSNATAALNAEPQIQTARFLGILDVLKGMSKSGMVMSPHLGKFLVHTTLKAGRPYIAFQFWSFAVLPSTQWDDEEHAQMRSSLRTGIEAAAVRGEVSGCRAEKMLVMLGRARSRTGTQ